ncbi:MAG: LysM peptidoglycan-binding domain-containing protein [Desulfobacteraceae bacterium]|nr:MAG: LysM peptidoglycan-binding domain-containing protein [Desulfobacteraceae bacterium]
MKRVLRKGSQQFNILEKREIQPDDKLKTFRDNTSALNFLRGLMRDNLNTAILRNIVKQKLSQTRFSKVGERKVIENLASQLVSGQLRIAVLPVAIPTWAYEAPELIEEEVVEAFEEKELETAWIKFQVVDDATGKPIPEINLKIALPDGYHQDSRTDQEGIIEIKDIIPGNCEVTCEIKGATLEDTLAFVSMGIWRSDKVDEDEIEDEPISGSLIAVIEKHKVKTGETQESVASEAGLTWQELAKFNWNTSDPADIDEHLSFDVGCTKTTEDGKSYIFDDSDNPGIIYVPKQWKKEALATDTTHTIRVTGLQPVEGIGKYIFSI